MNANDYFRYEGEDANEKRETEAESEKRDYMLWVYAVRFLDICALLGEVASAKCVKLDKADIKRLLEMAATCKAFAQKMRKTLENKGDL